MRFIFTATVFAILILQQTAARAELRSRDEAGLGFTNNANLEKDNTDSDLFLKLSSLNTLPSGDHEFGLRLGYLGYSKESVNDVLLWKLSDRYDLGWKDWKLFGAFGGQNYPRGNPGTTDVSFDNLTFELSGERAITLGERTELIVNPGTQVTYFTSFDGRTDYAFFMAASLDHELTRRLALGAHGELGSVGSTLAEYSKLYWEIGGSVDYALSRDWSLSGDLALRQSYFLSRTVSTQTVVTNKRGIRTTSTLNENEAYNHVLLAGEAMKRWNAVVRTGIGLNLASQASKSTYQDYTVAELLARALIIF